jgi:HAD superfamily hydrolase (TIGR01509 family)
MPRISPPKLVIFDCDGVLVDSEVPTIKCLQQDLRDYGLALSYSETSSLLSAGTFSGAGAKARKMGANLPDDWLEKVYERLYARLANEVELIPGVENVIDMLHRAGISCAVGSNGRIAKMEIMLRRVGLWSRLKHRLYSAQDLAAPKPSPDIYLKIRAEFGYAAADCVIIEDSATGAKAAMTAGISCFGYTAQTDPKKLAPYTTVVFADMRELPALLGLAPTLDPRSGSVHTSCHIAGLATVGVSISSPTLKRRPS